MYPLVIYIALANIFSLHSPTKILPAASYIKEQVDQENDTIPSPTAIIPTVTPPPQALTQSTGVGVEIINRINQERQVNGLPPLQENQKLNNSAFHKAQDILSENYWGHVSPDGKDPWSFFNEVGYSYTDVGENLARGYFDAEGVVSNWMQSATHRDNILWASYREIGAAIVDGTLDGQYTRIIVVHFGAAI